MLFGRNLFLLNTVAKIDENGQTFWRIRLWYRTQSTSDIFKYLYTTKSYADSGWKTSNGNIPEAMVITCNDNLLSRATNMNKYQKPYGLFQTEYKKISFNSWKERICPFAIRGNNSVRIELTDKAGQYAEEIGERHSQFLKLLFTDFNEDKIDLLFHLYVKLFVGIGEIRLMNIGNG